MPFKLWTRKRRSRTLLVRSRGGRSKARAPHGGTRLYEDENDRDRRADDDGPTGGRSRNSGVVDWFHSIGVVRGPLEGTDRLAYGGVNVEA